MWNKIEVQDIDGKRVLTKIFKTSHDFIVVRQTCHKSLCDDDARNGAKDNERGYVSVTEEELCCENYDGEGIGIIVVKEQIIDFNVLFTQPAQEEIRIAKSDGTN